MIKTLRPIKTLKFNSFVQITTGVYHRCNLKKRRYGLSMITTNEKLTISHETEHNSKPTVKQIRILDGIFFHSKKMDGSTSRIHIMV